MQYSDKNHTVINLLQGKLVVVTGGASGIGRAIAISCAKYGAAAIVIADMRNEPAEGGQSVIDAVTAEGCRCEFFSADVSNQAEVIALLAFVEKLGGVDVMACNAGIASPNDGADIDEADYRRILNVNLDGVFFCARAAANQMMSQEKPGSIVLTSSMGGLRGSAMAVTYAASKGAVCLLAKSLADSYGPKNIRVNAICPGIIETHLMKSVPAVGDAAKKMITRAPLRRMGNPSEVGDVVAWLGSDLSTYVTGTNIVIDGGLTSVV